MIVNPIKRRPTRKIRVGSVYVGGDAPISVQSMTNTETCDVDATVAQIQRCVDAGADIMRVSVPSMEAAEAFGAIRKRVSVPLVADIHFDHRIALAVADYGADCLRINPGNIGSDQKVREVVAAAKHHEAAAKVRHEFSQRSGYDASACAHLRCHRLCHRRDRRHPASGQIEDSQGDCDGLHRSRP